MIYNATVIKRTELTIRLQGKKKLKCLIFLIEHSVVLLLHTLRFNNISIEMKESQKGKFIDKHFMCLMRNVFFFMMETLMG